MSNSIAATAVVYPTVVLGEDVTIEDFCIIGAPFRGQTDEPTVIGDGAIIRSHTVIYAGNRIGRRFQSGNKANIRELNSIGDDVSIGTLSVVEHHVEIGDGVRIHTQAFVPEYSVLEAGAWIGPNVVLTNSRYPLAPDAKQMLQGPRVCAGAMIGANATLLPGVVIGAHALIGAGSVVTRDVEPRTIGAGNPARAIGTVSY
jgi:acetyltransferase-like isoleucine patch superfamily enzyme